jgi:diguanylate cyclase (GGDEF)-like protein
MNENASPYESLPPPFNEVMEPTQPNDNPTLIEQSIYDTGYKLGIEQVENMILRKQQTQLEHQATHDGLTSLLTKGPLIEAADRRLKIARPDQIFAMYFVDLDNFKSINDLHSGQHETGDMVLREMAAQLTLSARSHRADPDLVARGDREDDAATARLGGDEFAVFAELTDENDTDKPFSPQERYQVLLSRLETDLNNRVKELQNSDPELAKLNFGATIDGVIRQAGQDTTAAQMIAAADKLMLAKKNARKDANGGGYR